MTKLIPEPWVQRIAPKLIEQQEMWDELMGPIPAPDVPYPQLTCIYCGSRKGRHKGFCLTIIEGAREEYSY